LYQDGLTAVPTARTAFDDSTPNALTLGRTTTDVSPWFGDLDEIGIINDTALTAQQVCRWCSCGIRGEQCSCNGAAYVSKGRNATACNSCDGGLATIACNAAAP
jgi:hypothetical protein